MGRERWREFSARRRRRGGRTDATLPPARTPSLPPPRSPRDREPAPAAPPTRPRPQREGHAATPLPMLRVASLDLAPPPAPAPPRADAIARGSTAVAELGATGEAV